MPTRGLNSLVALLSVKVELLIRLALVTGSLMDNLSFQMNFVAPYNTLFAFNNVSLLDAAVAPPVVPGKPLPPFCSPANPPGVASAPCTLVQPMGVKLDGKTPAVASWNYSIEQQVARNMSLRLAYV